MGILRRALITFAFGLLFVFIQGTLIKAFFPGAIVPGLALVLVVFLAFYEPTIFGALLAFLLGLESDMCSGLVLGPCAGSFVAVFGIVSLLSPRIFVESPLAIIVTVFVASIISNFVFFAVMYQVSHSSFAFSWTLFLEALFTALCCVPLFALFRRTLLATGGGRRFGAHA